MKKEKWNMLYYIGLIYTIIPLVTSYGEPYFIWVLLTTLLFDICYIWIIRTHSKRVVVLCWLYLLGYITIFSSVINANASMFIFFQTNLLTFRFPNASYTSWKWVTIYVEIGIIFAVNLFKLPLLDMVVLLIVHSFAIGLAASFKYNMALTREREAQMESVSLLFTENDRNRIRRDLHDTLGHVFAMLSVKSELALALLDKQEYGKVKKELEDMMNVSRSSMKEVRHIVQQTQHINISDELHVLQHVLESSNIECTVDNKHLTENLLPIQENAVSLMLRELVTNVLKHSGATQCWIRFTQQGHQFVITVEDNGKGFSQMTGRELQTIQARMVMLKGTLSIVSLRQPTSIQLCLPMEG